MGVQTDSPGTPSHAFWGVKGSRWVQCEQGAWCHFVALNEDGQKVHRLAYMIRASLELAPEVKLAPEDNPVQLTLDGKIRIQQR